MSLGKLGRSLALTFLCMSGNVAAILSAQQPKKPFTVIDEIGLTLFSSWRQQVRFSPDGKYFAVQSERGRIDLNRPEGSLRVYGSQDVQRFLEDPNALQPPSPVWIVTRSTDKEGPIITDWRWLTDSNGLAFLERTADGNQRLVLADLRRKSIEPLTSASVVAQTFDVRDRTHYVYTVRDWIDRGRWNQGPAIVGTDRSIFELLLPDDPNVRTWLSSRTSLWAVVGSNKLEVKHDGAPVVPQGTLALSPDGSYLIAKVPVVTVPPSWETQYPPPFGSDPRRYRAGGGEALYQYVRINLQTGFIQSLTGAPTTNGGWANVLIDARPKWSSDGKELLLPGTFIRSKEQVAPRPCVALLNLLSDTSTCVEILKGRKEDGVEKGFHYVADASFIGGDMRRVAVTFVNPSDWSLGINEYERRTDGTWHLSAQVKGAPTLGQNGFEVNIKQGFNEPPMLVATHKEVSRVIWDPNPQLKNVEMGQADVYTWKDKEGRESSGVLYKPNHYKPGQRYPLVIQTHGLGESQSGFRPSGVYPTAFAARALAAAGIIVIQVDEHCPTLTPNEGPCAVSEYESAASQLVSEGVADPEKIGIIGFSRSCFYVMEALTTGSLHFKAASITDGVMEDYFQYLLDVGTGRDISPESDLTIGVKPFGAGLQQWLKRSPGFNLDKINSPLLVVGTTHPWSLLNMWAPYAGLRSLHKPVDLIILNTHEHVLTNPAARIASQGGSVDWFRFWLQNYEDPDPTKAAQYKRWRELRKLREKNEATLTGPKQ